MWSKYALTLAILPAPMLISSNKAYPEHGHSKPHANSVTILYPAWAETSSAAGHAVRRFFTGLTMTLLPTERSAASSVFVSLITAPPAQAPNQGGLSRRHHRHPSIFASVGSQRSVQWQKISGQSSDRLAALADKPAFAGSFCLCFRLRRWLELEVPATTASLFGWHGGCKPNAARFSEMDAQSKSASADKAIIVIVM